MSDIAFRLWNLGVGFKAHDDFFGLSWGSFHQSTGHKTWYVGFLWTTVVFVDLRDGEAK